MGPSSFYDPEPIKNENENLLVQNRELRLKLCLLQENQQLKKTLEQSGHNPKETQLPAKSSKHKDQDSKHSMDGSIPSRNSSKHQMYTPNGAKHQDATGNTNGAKHQEATGNTNGAKHQEATGNTNGAKHQDATGNINGAKHQEATGNTNGAKHQEATGNTNGAKQQDATGNINGAKHQEATGNTNGVKHQEATGIPDGAKYQEATDNHKEYVTHSPQNSHQLRFMQHIMGEIGFQLDRRILACIFPDRGRLYGVFVSNIPKKITEVCTDRVLGKVDKKKQAEMMQRYEDILSFMKQYGYDLTIHPAFTENIVNLYGIMKEYPPSYSPEMRSLCDPANLKKIAYTIVPSSDLDNILILLKCLSKLSRRDGKPLFLL